MDVTTILLLLLFGSIATFISGNKFASRVALMFSVIALVASIYIANLYSEGFKVGFLVPWIDIPKVFLAFNGDGLSLIMVLLTTALTPLIIFSNSGSGFKNPSAFYALILFMSFAMVGTFLAADGLLYYIFWELALIPIYFIALIWGNGTVESRKKAILKFFIFTLGGSLFMLAAFAYLYTKAGTFLIGDLYALELTTTEQIWIFLAFFIAYAIKIPLIPFHTWQAKMYQKAPTVGTMLLSGIMLKMGLYSIIRWQIPLAPFAAKKYMMVLIGLGIAGVIYGSIVALRQKDLKKLLAYSSLAHVGLIASGIYTLTLDGFSGAVSQMIAHGFVIVGLFFCAEIIFRRLDTRKIKEMGGIRQQTPKFSSIFMILVLASVALPGTFNFVGEFTVLYSLAQINIYFVLLGGLTIILGAYYMLKMFQQVMLGHKSETIFKDVTIKESVVLGLIVAFLLFFGLYPKLIVAFVTPSLQQILIAINR
jgi:NADH-quinone oxidoreductase subunit M